MQLLSEELHAHAACARLGACSRSGAFRAVKQRIDPAEYGGAPLLGVKGCCVIGHGTLERRAPSSTASAPPPSSSRSGVNAAIEAELRRPGRAQGAGPAGRQARA